MTTARNNDYISSLPGAPAFLSKQYSGFLNITETKKIHYFYVESEKNPVNDSIIFWTNGGPGCSGLLGLFTELGPWRPQLDGTLAYNTASWTSLASIVFLEQPAGVGFSYSTDANDLHSNDFKAARDNLATIREFYKRFPERRTNKMYLASESYGGHYIPQLTLLLLEDEELSQHFEGFLVGNPYTSFASGDLASVNTMWGLQLIDYPLWKSFTKNGCENLNLNALTISNSCMNILYRIFQETVALNPYALNFPICTGQDSSKKITEVPENHVQFRFFFFLFLTLQ